MAASKQASIHTRAQLSHASVGLAQAHPNQPNTGGHFNALRLCVAKILQNPVSAELMKHNTGFYSFTAVCVDLAKSEPKSHAHKCNYVVNVFTG